jgi:hypothetical protein
MGINFTKTIQGKVGDIIKPAFNGTNGFFQKPEWHVVTKIDKDGYILDRAIVYDWETIRAIQIMQELDGK